MELKPKRANRWRPSLLPRKAHRALVCMFFSFFKQHVQWLFSSTSTCISTRHVEPPLQLPYTPSNGPRPSLHVAPCHHSVHVQVTPAWPTKFASKSFPHGNPVPCATMSPPANNSSLFAESTGLMSAWSQLAI